MTTPGLIKLQAATYNGTGLDSSGTKELDLLVQGVPAQGWGPQTAGIIAAGGTSSPTYLN